jgi:hypothetical protein
MCDCVDRTHLLAGIAADANLRIDDVLALEFG